MSKKPKRPGIKRSTATRALDTVVLVDMVRRGYSDHSIAQHLGVSLATVSRDIAKILTELYNRREKDKGIVVQKVIEKLHWAQESMSKDYENSKTLPPTLFNLETGEKSSAEIHLPPPVGNPQIMKVFLEAVRDERELLALDYPKAKEVIAPTTPEEAEHFMDELMPVVKKAMELIANKSQMREENTTREIPALGSAQATPSTLPVPTQEHQIPIKIRDRLRNGLSDGLDTEDNNS